MREAFSLPTILATAALLLVPTGPALAPTTLVSSALAAEDMRQSLPMGECSLSWVIPGPDFDRAELRVTRNGETVAATTMTSSNREWSVDKDSVMVKLDYRDPAPDKPGRLMLHSMACPDGDEQAGLDDAILYAWDSMGNLKLSACQE